MKQKELLDAVLAGRILSVVEFRGSAARSFKNKDEQTKQESVRVTISHRVEIGENAEQQVIRETLTDEQAKGFDVDKYNTAPKQFKKGEKVVWVVKSYGWKGDGKGLKLDAAGHLEKLEA